MQTISVVMTEDSDTMTIEEVRERFIKLMTEAVMEHEKELVEYVSEQPHDTLFKAIKGLFRK